MVIYLGYCNILYVIRHNMVFIKKIKVFYLGCNILLECIKSTKKMLESNNKNKGK